MGSSPGPSIRPDHPAPRSLHRLVEEFGLELRGGEDADVEITGVAVHSGDVRPGDLYVAAPGAATHGARFAAAAREAGAVVLLTDSAGAELAAEAGLPTLVVDDPRAAIGGLSAWVYRTQEDPPLLLGVTGTNGKTSTAHLLEGVLRQLGYVTGLSSTAERRVGSEVHRSRLTTPEASELHAHLARMREHETRAAVIEVSAHALTFGRIDGIVFDVVGFTNLSRDHLDQYGDMEEYFAAKLALFHPDRARAAVVNVDDAWGARVAAEAHIPVTTIATAREGGPDADWRVTVLEETAHGVSFRLEHRDGRALETHEPFLGAHMALNAALAIAMLVESGLELEAIAASLEQEGGILASLPGRLERVSGESGPVLVVDYGHSPDAFRSSLAALRAVTPGRVVMVFGADGDRDTGKRPDMARAAAQGADLVIVTDYNPREEDPAAIRATLVAAAREVGSAEVREVPDPPAAIRAAVAAAGEGDSILWAGPGHEEEMEIRGGPIAYSARDDARQALREAGWE
ncbi:MAG: UDP-N-acetylmuramoyl-L-alanyl-D-glutamate--2,6-diaminopimelate ligase [Actinomycetales bacterium]|nr:UDP-N-acetylmuramoyl-L-alanyl-D-glutamate--2,6-diaminopimelate ligase [Actinomycetales bacterium]